MDNFLSMVRNTVAAVGEEIKHQAAIRQEEGLGLQYITRRILAMGLPFDDSAHEGNATIALPCPPGGISLRRLSSFLHKHHADRFMVWNLSEKSYDYSLLDNQVIEFKFPGHPAPPLDQVFALCGSLHAWLQADEANVAVIHCMTGRGRTLVAIAWYLAWSGQVTSMPQAVSLVCRKLNGDPERLLIPTQTRYLDYLGQMLAGKRPNAAPILLERVIMNGIPRLSGAPKASPAAAGVDGEAAGASLGVEACRPYLQIFRDAKLVYTSTGLDSTELRWYTAADSCVLFPVNLVLEGDILVRIRHLARDNKRVSMLRFGLHTGFVSPGNTRLVRAQLDGAYNDPRFDKSFWLDLVFRTPDALQDPDQAQAQLAAQNKREEYWEQINSARRQTRPEKAGADLQAPLSDTPAAAAAASVVTPAPSPSATAAAAAAPASSPTTASVASSASATAGAAKKSLNSFFSSAMSLFGPADPAAPPAPSAQEAAEQARLREAEEIAQRKAKRKAATEAAVHAALALSPPRVSPKANAPAKKPLGADPQGFADLQAYVHGLGNLDAHATEVDSDQEEAASTASASATHASAETVRRQAAADELDLDLAMAEHLDDSIPTSPLRVDQPTHAASASVDADDALLASLGLSPPTKASSSSAAAAPAATLNESADALEAELAALQGDVDGLSLDFGAGGGEELVLDDADEAALLASLQDELDTQ